MSLNRCLFFVKQSWSNLIFEKKRILIPIIVSVGIAVICASGSIVTSGIHRVSFGSLGFMDIGEPRGLRKILHRVFYIFPICSAICYLVLFYHLHQRRKDVLTKNRSIKNSNQGEHNVFVQLLITVIFYGVLSVVSEVLEFINLLDYNDLQFTLIPLYNIFNYLPEISLPFMLVLNNWKPKRRVAVFVTPTISTQSKVSERIPAK
ncbi:hypothetical protein GCK72_019954 [Caenorhabditis remanei]|uniref:Serpentine receptor class gamma n=1 Tax=Caenorhabditis remanei TaxID=31234 RepID=A0A6A5GDS4_CAERE|nr:hypothetical protein GCK72_019954 [Caenorhabditis remanei]KAF1753397.1 hypothetical protein GCK72_019954 [Caenorhabditis remanei]